MLLLVLLFCWMMSCNMPIFALPSDGSETLKLEVRTLDLDSIERQYNLYIPSTYNKDKATPLLFLLHGGGGSGKRMVNFTGFDKLAKEKGIIVICPEGYDKHWNDGRENAHTAHQKNVNDVAFIRKLIEIAESEFNIDHTRIYSSGVSNGAMMSYRLAKDLSDKIAAIGTVVGAIPEPLSKAAWNGRPVPAIIFNGTRDPLVPYEGGEVHFYRKKLGTVISVPETVSFLAKHNKCEDKPLIEDLVINNPKSNLPIKHFAYRSCCNNASVEFYSIEGGGHSWPRDSKFAQYLPAAVIGKACKDIDASSLIWNFFEKHPLESK